jgi:hypothetical protein
MRTEALEKATRVLVDLLDNPVAAIRLKAAEALADRLEGRPTARVEVSHPDEQAARERAEARALLDFWLQSAPEKFPEALTWAKAVQAGEQLPFPLGLPAPTTEPALGLWRRLLEASGPAALPEVTA